MATAMLNARDARRVMKTLKTLPDNLQRKVLTHAVNKTARKVVLPAVRAKVPVRTVDVFNLPYTARGLKTPMQSHLSPPGALKRAIYVQAQKRSRVRVGRIISAPSRMAPGKGAAELAVPMNYPGYYPAFLEYGWTTPWGTRIPPRPYLRGTFDEKHPVIMTRMVAEMNNRIRIVWKTGK